MSTEYTSKGNQKELLKKIRGRFADIDIDVDNVQNQLDALIQQGVSSPIYFDVDMNGDLYVYFDDGYGPPNVEYDEETGNMYWNFYLED